MKRKEAFYDKDKDVWEFRGSSFGGCQHGLVMALRGAEPGAPDPHTRARFGAGNTSEAVIKEQLREADVAVKGKPDRRLGVIWDAGDNWKSQRQVTGHYLVRYHPGRRDHRNEWVLSDYNFKPGDDHCTVTCALDGWGMGEHEFVERVGGIYTGGSVTLENIPDRYASWIWEHKSIQLAKFQALQKCAVEGKPYVLDPSKFAKAFARYAWQLSGQSYGLFGLLSEIFVDDPMHQIATRLPGIFFSTDLIQPTPLGYETVGKYLFYLPRPPFHGGDIAVRLGEVLKHYREGTVPTCDSEFRCFWPKPGPPKRTGGFNPVRPSEA